MPVTRLHGERGAILPLFALMIIVLLAFAALSVDLGMGWVQRRTGQNAVDAAAMAGALEYLEADAPTSADVVEAVRDYVSRNIDIPSDSADWVTCTDPDAISDGFSPMTDGDGVTMNCITLKQGGTGEDETLLRVKLPDRVVETAFARVIGMDTITVGAFAIAEIRYSDQSAILPMSLPSNHEAEECLGTPPSGQLKLDEAVACTGPDSGNFGLLDSPFFEGHNVSGTDENGCGDTPYPNFATRTPFAIAAGIDHGIQAWPDLPTVPDYDLGNNAEGADSCDADTVPPQVPYVLQTQTGNNHNELDAGLIGPGPYDSDPGRLRQTGGIGTRLDFDLSAGGDFSLDNVGLWGYLIDPNGSVPAECTPGHYGSGGVEGRSATEAITTCLDSVTRDDDGFNHPELSADLLTSPRFALVPVLAYERGGFTGNEWRAVIELKPVYLQTTWYDCGSSAANDPCLFQPVDWAADADPYSILFNPGEGTASPVVENNRGDYETPRRVKVDGVTAFVLEWDWLPDGAKNELGQTAPFEVLLYR